LNLFGQRWRTLAGLLKKAFMTFCDWSVQHFQLRWACFLVGTFTVRLQVGLDDGQRVYGA
jgi:hypothetical protein